MPRANPKATTAWRPLEDYTPFARKIVDYIRLQWPPISVYDLATRLSVTPQSVYFWLGEDRLPSSQKMPEIAKVLGISLEELQETVQETLYLRSAFDTCVHAALGSIRQYDLPPEVKSSIISKLNETLDEFQQNRPKPT